MMNDEQVFVGDEQELVDRLVLAYKQAQVDDKVLDYFDKDHNDWKNWDNLEHNYVEDIEVLEDDKGLEEQGHDKEVGVEGNEVVGVDDKGLILDDGQDMVVDMVLVGNYYFLLQVQINVP